MPNTVTVYLALGSNLGDRQANLRRALNLLSPAVTFAGLSPVYDTAPVGIPSQPRFLNMVARGKTALTPPALLTLAKSIEKQMGRKPGPPNSPRPLDIDILFYGDSVIGTPSLTVPHPRIAERAFVLAPLADIAPALKHPVAGKTARQSLEALPRTLGDAVRWRASGELLSL